MKTRFLIVCICLTVAAPIGVQAQNVLVPGGSGNLGTSVSSTVSPAPSKPQPAAKAPTVPSYSLSSVLNQGASAQSMGGVSASSIYLPAAVQNQMIQRDQASLAHFQGLVSRYQKAMANDQLQQQQNQKMLTDINQKMLAAAKKNASTPGQNAGTLGMPNQDSVEAAATTYAYPPRDDSELTNTLNDQISKLQKRLDMLQAGPIRAVDVGRLYQ